MKVSMERTVFTPADQYNDVEKENLAAGPGVIISVSVPRPSGGGAYDPAILLSDTILQVDNRLLSSFSREFTTFDTFTGRNNRQTETDWYMIQFPVLTTINCIVMTMGIPNRDGGWWTSLAVEVRSKADDSWRPVRHLSITPPYDFSDKRAERRPYDTYTLTFDDETIEAVRLIGQAGGLAQFTSLSRLAVYHHDLSRWNPAYLPNPPVPYLFQFITPQTIWDLSETLVKLTGLTLDCPLMEYYLDEARFERFWERIRSNYQGAPGLWFLIGDIIGWSTWHHLLHTTTTRHPSIPAEPYISVCFHNSLIRASAPVVVEGQVLGELTTSYAILKSDSFDWDWHRQYAAQIGIAWEQYANAIACTPHMTLEQMEAAATLLGMIAKTSVSLMHYKAELSDMQQTKTVRAQRKDFVRQAVDFMQTNLENPISVIDVARAVALSPAYFCTLFTEETGRNPSDYLIDLRITRAKATPT
jgi:hypothetical protein